MQKLRSRNCCLRFLTFATVFLGTICRGERRGGIATPNKHEAVVVLGRIDLSVATRIIRKSALCHCIWYFSDVSI